MKNLNPLHLKIGQKCLIRHKSICSPWIEVEIVYISEEGIPVGQNLLQEFRDALNYDEYEIDIQSYKSPKEEAWLAWKERSSRDFTKYPNEDSAFNYYWQMTH